MTAGRTDAIMGRIIGPEVSKMAVMIGDDDLSSDRGRAVDIRALESALAAGIELDCEEFRALQQAHNEDEAVSAKVAYCAATGDWSPVDDCHCELHPALVAHIGSLPPLGWAQWEAIAGRSDLPEWAETRLIHMESEVVSVALARNPSTSDAAIEALAAHENPSVRLEVARRASLPVEAVERLAGDADASVRGAIVMNEDLSKEVLERLAEDSWVFVRRHAKARLVSRSEK